MLRLTGLYPTRPLQINFDLLFQNVGSQWPLFGISVATPPFQAQPQAANEPTKPATAAAPATAEAKSRPKPATEPKR